MSEIKTSVTGEDLHSTLLRKSYIQTNDLGFVSIVVGKYIVTDVPVLGDRYLFEYHCWESNESSDAVLWHHTNQSVCIVAVGDCDVCYTTIEERAETGHPLVYLVRFDDGVEGTVFEDELLRRVSADVLISEEQNG